MFLGKATARVLDSHVPRQVDRTSESSDNNEQEAKLIRPLPKAPPRLIGHNKGRKRKTDILTDTLEKNSSAEQQANRKNQNESETIKKVKGKGKGKRVLQADDSSADEQECYSIIKL
ncbi:hypothetical protein WA026_010909 [Henosepilachna vigintioctopunctata]|uniref:Uncharacterized protein n=1 Tax=Henosepilachna vigintioctopunctata TaxID=420089 RepID=A0AAW1URG7_9CUCU